MVALTSNAEESTVEGERQLELSGLKAKAGGRTEVAVEGLR